MRGSERGGRKPPAALGEWKHLVFLRRARQGSPHPPPAGELQGGYMVPSACVPCRKVDADPYLSSASGTTHTGTGHPIRHTDSVHFRSGRCPPRSARCGRHGLAVCRCTPARSLGTAMRRGSAPRASMPCAASRSTHGLPRLASCALPPGGKRSGDAAAYGWVCEWARAHDLNETTPTVPVEFVAPLIIRT